MKTQLSVVFAVAALIGAVYAQDNPPETVDELDINLYLGRWYQMFANLLVNITFERDAFCVTADYGPINETYISVYNANRQNGPSGEIKDVNGYGFLPDPAEPGQLLVQLERGAPTPQQYWVLLLGPETFGDEGLYEYAVVSNDRRGALFVLARDVPGFRANYQEEVLTWLANNGFDGPLTEPLETYQEQDCEYAPAP